MSNPRDRSPVERHVAKVLAGEDLYFFTRWMFLMRKGYGWVRADHHRMICEVLMKVFRGEIKRLIINIPPRYSKTEIAVVNFIAWCFGKVPDCEFIHASYSGTLAANNSAAIRDMIKTPEYRQIFPDVRLASDAGHHWKTTAGGVMYACGEGGTITGFGAGKQRPGFSGAIVIDDPHKADEARSDTIRKGVIDWFQNTIESRKNDPENTPIILIMQRLHESDLSGFLLGRKPGEPPRPGGNGEVWEHLCLDAFQKDEDGNEVPLWPAKHSIEMLRVMEKAAPYTFAGQYRQRPSPPGGGVFKPDQIEIVDAIPAGKITWVRGWDFGSTTTGDYTAGGKLGKMEDGRYIIADQVRVQESPDDRDRTVLNTATRDGKQTKISIPQDPGQAGKTQVKYMTRGLAGYNVVSSPESGDKVVRAEPFAAQVNVGNVLMLRGPWNQELIDEMRTFPNGAFDDQIDSLSRSFGEFITTTDGMIDYYAQLAAGMVKKSEGQKAEQEAKAPGGLFQLMTTR